MKSIKFIMCFAIIIAGLLFTKSYAVEASVNVNGSIKDDSGVYKYTVHVGSTTPVNSVSGKISGNNISNIEVQPAEDWEVTYDESTGQFDAVNEFGATDSDVVVISFTESENAKEDIWIKINAPITVVTNDSQELQLPEIKQLIATTAP